MVRSNLRKGYYFNSPLRMQEGGVKKMLRVMPATQHAQ
jgi:hypothetical protein